MKKLEVTTDIARNAEYYVSGLVADYERLQLEHAQLLKSYKALERLLKRIEDSEQYKLEHTDVVARSAIEQICYTLMDYRMTGHCADLHKELDGISQAVSQ